MLVLSRVPVTTGRTLIAPLLDLLDACPSVDVIVCIQGSTSALLDIATRGIDCTFVTADDLAFTRAETAELFRLNGVTLDRAAVGELHDTLGGAGSDVRCGLGPPQLQAGSRTDRHGLPGPGSPCFVDQYVADRPARLAPEHRVFALSIAAASRITQEDAAVLTGREDAGRLLVQLETVGLMVSSFSTSTPTQGRRCPRPCPGGGVAREKPEHVDELLAGLHSSTWTPAGPRRLRSMQPSAETGLSPRTSCTARGWTWHRTGSANS